MKTFLKLNEHFEITLEVHAENDVEAIALKHWSDLNSEDQVAAKLLIVHTVVAPNTACTGRDATVAVESKEEWASRQ